MRIDHALWLCCVSAAVSGCGERICRPQYTDNELLAKEANSSLEEIYQKHERLVHECTPPRLTLSGKLADFGKPAKDYAMSKLITGDARSFIAVRSTVSAVNSKLEIECTSDERDLLLNAAKRIAISADAREVAVQSVEEACRPWNYGDRNYGDSALN